MCIESYKKVEHPNRLLRLLGNAVSAFGIFLIKIAEPYATVFEWEICDDTCEKPFRPDGEWY